MRWQIKRPTCLSAIHIYSNSCLDAFCVLGWDHSCEAVECSSEASHNLEFVILPFFLCSITNIKDGDRTWLRLWANIYWGRFPVSNWCHKSERAGFHSLWIKDVLPSFIQWTFFVHSFFQEKMTDRETGWAWWEQALSSIWCHNHFGSWFRKNRFPARSSWHAWLMIIPRESNRRSSWFERSPERISTSKK